jgi:hypothetical protein
MADYRIGKLPLMQVRIAGIYPVKKNGKNYLIFLEAWELLVEK